jgi:hypothetical protein
MRHFLPARGLRLLWRGLRAAMPAAMAALGLAGAERAAAQPRPSAPAMLHVSPAGAGDNSGRDVANPMRFDDAVPVIEAGDGAIKVVLQRGDYRMRRKEGIRLAARRGPAQPLMIQGAGPSTRFIGEHQIGDERARPLFLLSRGDVTLSGFSVIGFGKFLEVSDKADARNVRISGIDVERVQDGIMLDRRRRFIARDWIIEDVSIRAYKRVGIRLSGEGTSRFTLRRVQLDGAGAEGHDDCHKGGVQLFESVSDIAIDGMRVANNVGCPAKYQQGDGVEADNKDGAPRRITLRNIEAIGNRDGNFDLKASDMVMENLTSRGEDVTRFGFRFWHYAYDCVRCVNAGSKADLSLRNATVTFTEPRFEGAEPMWRCSDQEGRTEEILRVVRKGRPMAVTDCAVPGPPGSPSGPRDDKREKP